MAGKPKPIKKANEAVLKAQPEKWVKSLAEHNKRIFLSYPTTTKLRAVLRWPQRMASARINAVDVAAKAKISKSRISEYCTFYAEPKEETFLLIESTLYKMGA